MLTRSFPVLRSSLRALQKITLLAFATAVSASAGRALAERQVVDWETLRSMRVVRSPWKDDFALDPQQQSLSYTSIHPDVRGRAATPRSELLIERHCHG